QSVVPQGPQPPERAPSQPPAQLGKTALPTQPASELIVQDASERPAASPASKLECASLIGSDTSGSVTDVEQQQLRLQQLSRHEALHSGELNDATAVITQFTVEILNIDRASLWFYNTDDFLELSNSYSTEAAAHQSELKCGLRITTAEHHAYLEPLAERNSLLVEQNLQTEPLIQSLGQAKLLLSGAFLDVPIYAQGKLVGVLWCECEQAHRWTALEQASALSIGLLTTAAFEAQQRRSQDHTLTQQRQQLKRETIEREQAEIAWQESQRFIQGIIDASTNILYVDSFADGSNFYINRWIQNVLGYTPTDLQKLGPHYLEKLVHADEKPHMAEERRKLAAINDGEVVENEYRFRHRQGNWRWLLCRETVFQRDDDGQPTQIFGTATDITKHKHAEVALKEFNAELERLARMDGLTQVANRRSFDEYLAQEWENLGSGRSALSLILCDIDYFKSFNDTYGHQAGDVCLRRVAKAIEKAVKRSTDLVARYGGEEFAIILPNTNHVGVKRVAEEIQKAIKKLSILHSCSEVSDYITLSLGLSSIVSTENAHPDMLVASADQGLYQAKYSGRDRYCEGQIDHP
ncbi:MAG: diguanylate cyclase, partial [Cyanobacteria bacterium J06560_2]